MNNKELLLKEIEDIPEGKIQEVIDFIHFLKWQDRKETLGFMQISESSLAEVWDNPKDDEAWNDL